MYTKLEFELEFITPAFIGEAFPEEETDLRPASLIGSLRYWFRQLLGTLTDDVEKIYNLESALFGNQNRAGLVRVRVEKKIRDGEFVNLKPLRYIGYGVVGRRAYIPPETAYLITFLVPKNLEQLFLSFLYLYNFLGSLGGRSRRGWGNFVLKPIKGIDEEFKELDWENFKKDNFKRIFNNLKDLGFPTNGRNTLWIFKVFLWKPGNFQVINKPKSANILINLNNKYKNFRKNQKKYFFETKKRIIYNCIWLGLPLRINNKIINLFFKSENNREKATRLASPVIFRVVKTSNGYSLLILVKEIPSVIGKNREGLFFWKIPNKGKVKAGQKLVSANKSFSHYVERIFLQKTFRVNTPLLILP